MNKTIGIQVALFSVLLAAGSAWFEQLRGNGNHLVFIAGLAGAGLCLVWAILAMLGSRSKAWTLLTLIPASFVLLSEVVHSWTAEGRVNWKTGALVTGLFLLCLGMLMRVAYAESPEPPRKPVAIK